MQHNNLLQSHAPPIHSLVPSPSQAPLLGGGGAWERGYTHPVINLYFARFYTQGIVHGLVTIAQTERLPGLYRGIGPTLFAIAPFMAVQQASYDMLKQQAMLHEFKPNPTLFFICGSIAGATAQTVSNSLCAVCSDQVHDHPFQNTYRVHLAKCVSCKDHRTDSVHLHIRE